MRIDGQWLWCDDGIMRPVISGEILAGNGSWEKSEFLVDTGADRTVLSTATLAKLCLQPLPIQEGISGLGGTADSVIVETQLRLTREDAGVSVNSFLDTRGPTMMRHELRPIVVPSSLGQGLCLHAVQSTPFHGLDAGPRAAPGGVLPRYPRSSALRGAPCASG